MGPGLTGKSGGTIATKPMKFTISARVKTIDIPVCTCAYVRNASSCMAGREDGGGGVGLGCTLY